MPTETVSPMMWRTLAESDPTSQRHQERASHRQNSGLELIASENFVKPGDSRGGRLGAHEQVRRRVSGAPLLRRAANMSMSSARGDRSPKALFGAEQPRPAGTPARREHGRVHDAAEARATRSSA